MTERPLSDADAGGAVECRWCGCKFQRRCTGGSTQRFCSSRCRGAFNTACRIYAGNEVDAGRLQVSELKMVLQQRVRCVQRP